MKRTEALYLSHCFQSYQTNVSNFSIFSGHWITMFDPFSQYVWDLFEGLFNLVANMSTLLVHETLALPTYKLTGRRPEDFDYSFSMWWEKYSNYSRKLPKVFISPTITSSPHSKIIHQSKKKQGNLVIFQMNNILHHLPISDKYIRQCSLVWSRI